MSMKYLLLYTLYLLFCICQRTKALCSNNPKCTCQDLKGKGFKLKCSQIGNIEDLLFHELTNASWNIIQLDLSNNSISIIHTESFPLSELTKLVLDRNNIEHIEKGAFLGLINLTVLRLSNNKLKRISKDMFEGLLSLETLNLNQNFLTSITNGTFSELKSLSKLVIGGNPLNCNCDIWWLRINRIKLTPPIPKCESPKSLHGQFIDKITLTDLGCSWVAKSIHTLRIDPDQNQIAFEGDSLKMVCEVNGLQEDDNEEKFIYWTWDGYTPNVLFENTIDPQNFTVMNNGLLKNTLVIEDLIEKHSGKWTCNFISVDVNETVSVAVRVISRQTAYCRVLVTENNKGRYTWQETVGGYKVKLPCEVKNDIALDVVQIPYVTHVCSSNGSWVELNTDNCPYTSSITRILQQFSKMNLTYDKKSLMESAFRLRNFTLVNLRNITNVIDVHYMVTTLENYIKFLEKDSELGYIVMDVIAYVLKLSKNLMEKAQQQHFACSRLITVIQSIAKYTPRLEFQDTNLAVVSIPITSDIFTGMTCSWFKDSLFSADLNAELNCSNTNLSTIKSDTEASIQVPARLFDRFDVENLQSSAFNLMIAMFKDNRLFPDRNNNKESSVVVSANLIDFKTSRLDEPLYIILKNHGDLTAPILAWWNSDTSTWVKEGCRRTHGVSLIFECYRLGYFSLVSDQDETTSYSDKTVQRQLLFSFLHPSVYVGTFVCVTCLMLASATYCTCYSHIQMSKKMKHSLANTWLSASFFFLIFSLGIHQTEYEVFCQGIGLTIHYFALATLFWMAVTVKALYKRVQKSNPTVSTPSEDIPSDVSVQKPILGIYLVGWGISLILCGIAGAVNIKGYAGLRYCFLTPGPALSTVLIPVSLVLFYLLIMCLLIKCAASSPESNPQLSVGTQAIDLELLDGAGRSSFTHERCSSVRSVTTPSSQAEDTEHSPARQLKAFVIFLVFYLGVVVCAAACVMHPFQWPYEEKLFSFAYALLCVLSGSFVIFFHCFARNDVRSAWSRILRGKRFRKPSPHIIANSLLAPITTMRPNSNDLVANNVTKPSSTPNDDASAKSAFFLKRPSNVNLINLHRQHYRGCNTKADNFYNPHQSIVAKKFFKKQRKKRCTLQVRKCRSGGSSPVSASLFDGGGCGMKTAAGMTEDENAKFLREANDRYDELNSEKHPLTYDEPDITGGEGKTGTESEATFTVPEYAEIQENLMKYDVAGGYKTEMKEQMCGTSDRDWCSCDAISDVNSEPTYNYAYIKNGYGSSRSAMSDNSSANSHLYTAVAPDIVSSVDRFRRRPNYRQPVSRNSYRNNRSYPKYFGVGASAHEFKRKRKDACKLSTNVTPTDFSSEDKVETCV